MGEKPAHGYRGRIFVALLNVEPREVFCHWVVELKLAAIAKLQDTNAREELRDRADAVYGLRRCARLTLAVCEAEPPTPQERLIVDDSDRDTGDVLVS